MKDQRADAVDALIAAGVIDDDLVTRGVAYDTLVEIGGYCVDEIDHARRMYSEGDGVNVGELGQRLRAAQAEILAEFGLAK